MSYASVVGDRLRKIRLQKGLSLHDVQNMSKMEFKASVLGAYERGERSISVPRLERLARLYQVPVDHLLPRTNAGEAETPPASGMNLDKIRIDLKMLEQSDHPSKAVLQRYLNLVQIQRSDFNGRVLTIRNDDLRALASVLDLSPDNLASRIEEMGILAED
ncbi:MAG: transcriptional regulator [Actinomycetota bacterium]|nr:transcriptional regulator [Actinomycetota bacterium]